MWGVGFQFLEGVGEGMCEAALADGGRDRGFGLILGSASWA